jgi:GTPase SAR1 family protein
MRSGSCTSHSSYSISINSLLRLSILISALTLADSSTNVFGQIAIPLSEVNPKLTENIIGKVKAVEFVEERLFIGTEKGLWILENNNTEAKRVGAIKEPVLGLHVVGNQIIAETGKNAFADDDYVNVWIVSINGTTTKIEGMDKDFASASYSSSNSIADAVLVGEHFFILANVVNEGGRLWVVDKQGRAKLVEEPMLVSMAVAGDEVMVSSVSSLFLVNQNGEARVFNVGLRQNLVDLKINKSRSVGYGGGTGGRPFYKIDGNKFINSELIPDSWWGKFIASILPENYLPAGKVPVVAYYSDGFGKRIDEEQLRKEFLPGGFRFAVADGSTIPSDEKFSPQGVFNYQIDLGKNEVHFWIKDKYENAKEFKKVYYGIPSQYFIAALPIGFSIASMIFVLNCFFLAPKVGFCHSAVMNPWLRKYFSLGSVPLLLSIFPSLRRHLLSRYSDSVNKDKEFNEWKNRFVCPDEEFQPDKFGDKLESERKLLITGQSGIGKTSFLKRLTANYASQDRPTHPAKVFPVYIPLTNYGGNSLEDLVYNQLFSYGKITDKELAPMFLEQGGLLIFLDGVNEVQNVTDRQKLSAFVEKFWTSNYICLSSQHPYSEIENIPKVELKPFSGEKVREFIRQRVRDKETAESVIKRFTDQDYQLYSIPRDLEFAVEILNSGRKTLPRSRTELYKITFSSIFAKWREKGTAGAEDILCKRAYTMIVQRDLTFDSVDDPHFKEITADLFEQKFLVRRERSYNFRHDLIRSYLASEYFYPRWNNLFEELTGKPIDSNWLEMLKFSCENIEDSAEVKSLVYEVLKRSVRKDLVKNLFEWLKANHPSKCKMWEAEFYAKYGELDFR